MTQNQTFWRKIIYLSFIPLLMIALSFIAQPSTRDSQGAIQSPGGVLAKIRDENQLSQANLGDIDPASETMKLATLGLKGVAVTVLWHNANTYKDEENWEAFSATVNQIIKLQPNFITVWEFQAHNIAYNVSVEFDDYQARYEWVKRGLDFLIQGLAYNRRDYKILRNLGMFYGTKIGRSDEALQFRDMFRKDRDYHDFLADYISMDDEVTTPYGVDNWLVARQWYLQAEAKILEPHAAQPNSELMFYKDAPGQLRNSAMDLEKEFRPEEPARRIWERAFDAWNGFGNRSITTSWETELRLNDKAVARDEVLELEAEMDKLAPGVRDRLFQEKWDTLDEEMQAAYRKEPNERNPFENQLALSAYRNLRIDNSLVAAEVEPQVEDEAYRLLRKIQNAEVELGRIENYRSQTNYLYWLQRCRAEQTPKNLQARAAMYDARDLNEKAILTTSTQVDPLSGESIETPGAKEKFEESFQLWAEIFLAYPELMDGITADEMLDATNEYRLVLERLVEPFPEPFVLDFLFEKTGTGEFAEEMENLEAIRRARDLRGPPTEPQGEIPDRLKSDDDAQDDDAQDDDAGTDQSSEN